MRAKLDSLDLVRDSPLKASRLGVLELCSLRYLLEDSHSDFLTIPLHPLAILGTEIHKAVEHFELKALDHNAIEFASLVKANAEMALARNPIVWEVCREGAHIGRVIEPSLLNDSIGIAYRTLKKSSVWQRDKNPRSKSFSQSARRRLGPEIDLESPALDLKGRADRVERIAHQVVRVTDLKTGYIFNDGKELKRSHWLQIASYAAMLEEEHRHHEIEMLVLGGNDEWSERYGIETKNRFLAVLVSLREKLPRGRRVNPHDLANAGTHCSNCRARPSCPTYTDWAPRNWADGAEASGQPLDIWGTVTGMESREDGTRDMRIDDVIGHSRLVRNLPNALFADVRVGDVVAIYNLKTKETGRGGKFPYNFLILDRRRPFDSAYDAYLLKSLPAGLSRSNESEPR